MKSPLKAQPHRVPGQSVDEERVRLLDDAFEPLLLALVMTVLAGLEWFRFEVGMKPAPVVFTVAAVLTALFAAWRIWRALPKIRALRQARDGERAVGQFLERVRTENYQVFHDVIGEGFNVDHVLIGPAGVFTVETKTWSKPLSGKAEIKFDGKVVRKNDQILDRDPVVQAKAQANWIRSLLTDSTGRAPFVKPVVVFPGWYVVNSRGSFAELWVLEPKALPAFLANEPERLSDSDVQLFSYHLSRHIRVSEAR